MNIASAEEAKLGFQIRKWTPGRCKNGWGENLN